MKRRRAYFTLLEILVVIFIITLGVALTGVKVKGIYEEQRFFSEGQQVLNHLTMAQDLMLIMDADVEVKVESHPEKEMLQIWIEVEKPLKESWARLVERKTTLRAIRSFTFDEIYGKSLTLLFSLGNMSQGILTLYESEKRDSGSSGSRIASIELLGYPNPLKIKTEEEKGQKRVIKETTDKSQALYPAEVYEKLYKDPNAKDLNPKDSNA